MKDRIIKLANGIECYVIEEVLKDRRKFFLAYEVDTQEGIVQNRFMILEEKIENGTVVVVGLNSEERMQIASLLIEKIKKNIEDSNI